MTENNEDLVRRIQAGEKDLIMTLWSNVEKLIYKFAYRYYQGFTDAVEMDDLLQSGAIAMLEAVNAYDPEKGAKFSTFLVSYLRSEFSVACGFKNPSDIKLRKIGVYSLQAPASGTDDAGATKQDVLVNPENTPTEDATILDVEDRVYNQEVAEMLQNILNQMDAQQREVLQKRYYNEQTLEQTASQMGIHRNDVVSLEQKALRRMRGNHQLRSMRYVQEHSIYTGNGLGAFNHTGSSLVERIAIKIY